MEDRETPRMHKYGESKTTQIMMATVRHVTSSLGLRKFQADGFLFNWVYHIIDGLLEDVYKERMCWEIMETLAVWTSNSI